MLFGHALLLQLCFFVLVFCMIDLKQGFYFIMVLWLFLCQFFHVFFLSLFCPFWISWYYEFCWRISDSVGCMSFSTNIFFFNCFPLIISLIFSLNLFVKIFFGIVPFFLRFFCDITRLEFLFSFF